MNKPSTAREIVMGAVFLIVVAGVAALGSLATLPHTDGWYADVEKAPWSPPNWLFGPAWSVLYVAIAMAGWLIWRRGFDGNGEPNRARRALSAWIVQMVLNCAWTPAFFAGYPLIGAAAWWVAMAIMVALIASVIVLIALSARWSKIALVLLLPYLGWLLFASSLNAAVIALN